MKVKLKVKLQVALVIPYLNFFRTRKQVETANNEGKLTFTELGNFGILIFHPSSNFLSYETIVNRLCHPYPFG